MTEKRAAERFIYQALSTDPALVALVGTKIGRGSVAQGTVPPYVIYSLQSGVLLNAIPANLRVLNNMVYLCKAVIKGDSAIPAFDIEDRFDRVLIGNSGPITIGSTTYQVGPFAKQSEVEYDEVTPEGQHFIHSGGLYRAWVYQIS